MENLIYQDKAMGIQIIIMEIGDLSYSMLRIKLWIN